MTAKVVAIKCPSCKGTGKFSLADEMKCMWCNGKKKLRRADALRFARQTTMLATGGYICGDHDWNDRKEMLQEADAICAAFKVEIFDK